jgi:glycosyltransferase involved in cell wall biosynthesis
MAAATAATRPRVLVSGPVPPPYGGIATVIDAIFASGIDARFALERFATNRARTRRGPAGRLWNSLLARGFGFDAAWNLDARDLLAAFGRALEPPPALVHLHSWHGWDFWVSTRMAALARERGARSLLQLHGNFDAVHPTWSRRERAGFGRALRAPDRIVALSRSWQRWLGEHVDSARIDVLPNAVDTERFRPVARERDERAVVLFVGTRDAALKGAHDLLAAAPAIAAQAPGVRFRFVGEDKEQLAARVARDPALAGKVEFSGGVAAAEMPACYAAADLIALPSHREAVPMALLEAMASGLPIAASALHGIREVLADAPGNALFEPGDRDALAREIAALARDPARRARVGAANRALVERSYGRARYVAALAEIYDRVLAG